MSPSKTVLSLAAWMARVLPMPLKRRVYRVRPLARLIRGGLNRAAPQGLAEVEVAAGALAGCRLALDLQTEKDYWLGTYEPEVQAALAELAQPGMTAYDVGANVGYISLQLAQRVGPVGRVFAFEALPSNQERLRRNLALNGLDGRVEVVAAAVLDATRPARFLVGPSGGMGKAEGSAGRKEFAYAEAIEVPGVSLDDFVYSSGHPAPDLVKMDIEGGEVLALPGIRRVLQDARPVLLMELHGPESAKAAWETLTAAGYRLCRMAPGFPQVAALDELDWKAYLVAFPEE
jgi:FkbM family methyltransferase